jgi:WD40 repeat protein
MMLVWNPVKDAGGEVLTLSAASDRRVAISADGACLLSGGRDGAIRLWCVKSKRCVRTFEGHTARISDLAIVADGRLAISGSDDGYARVWDVAANRCLRTLFAGTQAKAVTAVAIARAGPFACTGHEDASLRMWELQTGRYLRRFKNVHEFKISAVAMSDDGSLIGSADASRRICIWDGLTGSLLHMFDHHGASVTGLALTQNERLAVSVGNDDTVKIWDLAFPGKEFRIWAHTDAVFCASRLTNRRPFDIPLALSGSSDKMVRLWDTRTGYCLRTLPGHRGPIYAVAFLPVRGQATSISSDGTIHVWNLKQGFAHRILPDSSRGLTHFAFDMKNGLAITVRADDIPTIWDLNRGCRIGTLTLSGSKLVGIAWLPNTTTVLTIDNSAVVRIHSVPAGETGYEWKVGCAGVVAWALSDDGEILALANDENALQVYDLHSRSCLSDLGNLCTRSRGLTFSKDRTALVSFDAERRVVVWHLTTDRGSDVFTLRNENKSISRVQVHPRAQYLACAQGASLVFVDLVRKEILSEYGCESEITSFSEVCPDGTTICGTRLGHLHFLKLRGWESPPVESHLI